MNNFKQIILLVTKECNLGCLYCYIGGDDKDRGKVSNEIIDRAVECLNPDGSVLQITGGEPLLYPETVFYIVKKTLKLKPKTQIKLKTNGTLIDESIASFIKNNHIKTGVSLDGPPEVNDDIRGMTLETLKGISRLGKQGININLTAVITNRNVESLDRLSAMSVLMGNVGSISFDLLRKPAGRKYIYDSLMPDIQDLKTNFSKAYDMLYRNKTKTVLNDILISSLRHRRNIRENLYYCWSAMGESITVTPGGEIFTCPSLINDRKAFLGNILDTESIEKRYSRNAGEMERCSSCRALYICRGGCPSRAYLEGKDIMETCELECSYRKYIYDRYIDNTGKYPERVNNSGSSAPVLI